MAEGTPGKGADEQAAEQDQAGLGFRQLSMNEIPASATEEESEAPRRAGRLALVLAAALVLAVAVFIGGKVLSNLAPGQEAGERLRERVATLPAWQKGLVMDVEYVAGNRVRLKFSSRASTRTKEARDVLRDTARAVMEVVISERPDRDLHIEGYKGDEQILRADYRLKTTVTGPGGEQIKDIVVRVEGDSEDGIGGAYDQARPAVGP